MLSPLEWVMAVLILALAAVVITIGVTLNWAAAFIVASMGAFGLACLAGAVGLGGSDQQ